MTVGALNFPNLGNRSGGGGGGLFLKLGDGDKISGVLQGEFKMYRTHWVQSTNRYQACDGDGCGLCKMGDEPKTKAKINFITKEDGVWVAKVWDMSLKTFIDLRELQENGYPLKETAISITRKGEKKDTKYIVIPLKNNGGLAVKDFKAIAAVPLNPLGESKPETAADESGDANEEDVPF